jgi:hypothetical protein
LGTGKPARSAASALLLLFGCLPAFGAEVDPSLLPPPATNHIEFTRDIRPILEDNCLRCHGPEKPKSQFRLDNRAAALKGGEEGADVIPGNSAQSRLIQYVARLAPDSEMPPPGKGNPLTPAQISALRAWIDQGLVWARVPASNSLVFAFSPQLGGTSLSGNQAKFRELNWQPGGWDGGAEQFELFKQLNPDTKLLLNGHAARDDYATHLALDRSDFGFLHAGWQQYRKYFDDTGGYDPRLDSTAPSLGQDLHLDVGQAWVDVGLTLPDWPRLVLGYEYDYKQGQEATTEWNHLGTNSATARNLGPASEHLREAVHTVKVDLDYDYQGWTVEDRFRGEFYHLSTGSTNLASGAVTERVNESTTYFQGANTFRLEKKFSDWFLASGGYQYSQLNADSTFQLDQPTLLQSVYAPNLTLERDSNVGNLNALFGPLAGFTLSAGVLADFTRQNGLGPGVVQEQLFPPMTNIFVPFAVGSAYDQSTVEETAALRFSKIPFTDVFAEGRLEQQDLGQFDQFASPEDVLNKAVFTQHTQFASRASDLRLGFNTSPWRFASLSAHYRYDGDDSRYDSSPLVQPSPTAYPAFLTQRDLNTHEFEARLALHPSSLIKTTLSYQAHDTEYDSATRPYALFGTVLSRGGELAAGRERGQTVSLSASVTPLRRLYLDASVSYQDSTLTTAADGSPAVLPYQGHTITVLASGTYVLSQHTDLFAAYFFSLAEYGQNNFAHGLPLGLEYQRQGAQFGLSRRLGKNVSAKLQYRFDCYREPSSSGVNNYLAHSIYGALSFQFR